MRLYGDRADGAQSSFATFHWNEKKDPVLGVILQGYFFVVYHPQLGRVTKMILSFHFNLGLSL